MKVSHIEHLGIAVKSLDTAIPYWEKMLGTKCYNIEEVADQKVRTPFQSRTDENRVARIDLSGGIDRKIYRETGRRRTSCRFCCRRDRTGAGRMRVERYSVDRQGASWRSRGFEYRFPASQIHRWGIDRAV